VQRPGRASKWHGASSRQRLHPRQRLAIRDQMARRATSHRLGSPNPGQLGHGILTLLPGVGSEAVLPTDVAFGAPRIQHYEEGTAEETRKVNLDSIEEHRVTALMRHTRYEQQR
jgi:hypothetical protein